MRSDFERPRFPIMQVRNVPFIRLLVVINRHNLVCRRDNQNAADDSKTFFRCVQGFRRRVQGFRRRVQRFHRRCGNAADATSYPLNRTAWIKINTPSQLFYPRTEGIHRQSACCCEWFFYVLKVDGSDINVIFRFTKRIQLRASFNTKYTRPAVRGYWARAAAVRGGGNNQVDCPWKRRWDFDVQTFYVRARMAAFSQECRW